MKVGFTGTQVGMSDRQKDGLRKLLRPGDEFHHGDCIGADEEAHAIAREIGCIIVTHPPINESKRAFCKADRECTPREYLVRNKDIVDDTIFLIAAPKSDKEETRSGTWSTVRYGERVKTRVHVLPR